MKDFEHCVETATVKNFVSMGKVIPVLTHDRSTPTLGLLPSPFPSQTGKMEGQY
jgi:hypothetical protein